VARNADHQFLRIGVRASVLDDSQQMLMSAALLQHGDVVMAFSYSGQTAAACLVQLSVLDTLLSAVAQKDYAAAE